MSLGVENDREDLGKDNILKKNKTETNNLLLAIVWLKLLAFFCKALYS